MIYMRGQSRDYDQWAALTGDDTWRWDQVLPAFKQHEDYYLGADELHGAGGEWRVEQQRLRWDILDAFAQAAQQAGIPHTTDFNRGSNEGVGYFQVNQKNGWRWNTAKAFLRPTCYGRPNFELWTGAQVSRLLLDTGPDGRRRCTGVQVWDGHEMVVAHATREVILCAGSIGSPQILQLSGIGPAELLRQHGIEVALDAPGVGANLQDHLQIRAVYKIKDAPTLNVLASSLYGKAKIGLEYLLKRSGPMSMAPSQLGAFTRSSPEHEWPNLEYHVQPLSLDAFGEPLHSFPAFTASVCNLNPTSRGTVRIKSHRFSDAPAIAPNYLSTDEDRKVAADSLRVTRRIAAQPALAKYRPEEWKPGLAIPERRGAGAAGRRHRHHHLPPGRHHPDGRRRRSDGRAGFAPAGARHRRPARGRCRRHAHHHQRQHQQPHPDDRGEGGRLDSRGRRRFVAPSCFCLFQMAGNPRCTGTVRPPKVRHSQTGLPAARGTEETLAEEPEQATDKASARDAVFLNKAPLVGAFSFCGCPKRPHLGRGRAPPVTGPACPRRRTSRSPRSARRSAPAC